MAYTPSMGEHLTNLFARKGASMDIGVLVGQTLTSVYKEENGVSETLVFVAADGKKYRMYNRENSFGNDVHVTLEEIHGNLEDLLDTPIFVAEEASCPPKDKDAEEDWTFYKFRTIKGSVTLRWYGCSNGYYSEKVDFEEYKEDYGGRI